MTEQTRDVREIVREEMLRRREILEVLAKGPQTVPAIAVALGVPAHEAMYWVMGLRKYGWVAESGDADEEGHFLYRAIERKGA